MQFPEFDASAPARAHRVASPHGERVDPYYWLRDDERTDPEVLAYLRSENAYHTHHLATLKPLVDKIESEILARLKQDDSTVPYRKNGYWYYTRFEPGKEHPIFARREDRLDAPEQVMLDANELAAGHEYYQIGGLEVSPNSAWLAFCEDTVGRRQYGLRFKNLVTGELLPVMLADVEPDLAWANDNATVLYIEKDPQTLLGLRVKKHLLGSDPEQDALVFEQTDNSLYTGVTKSKSDRFIFIHMEGTLTSEWWYADAGDPALSFQVFFPRQRDHEYEIEHLGDRFIIRTNWQARNFRLMEVPIGLERSQGNWQDVVVHCEHTYIEDFEVFDDYIALSARSGGLRKIAIRPVAPGAEQHFIASDEPSYTMSISTNPDMGSEMLRYTYTSLATPTTVYDYDMRTGEKTFLKREPVLGDFDPANYQTELLFAPAHDGKRIPVSLIHRRDFVRDGSAPLLQYAYGSYGLSSDPRFLSARFSLIDRGFVYAIAHVRGGQEMGRSWYEEGRLLHKKNSFTDFIDVTHHLVGRGYAARDKVFAMGASAGGLLMGVIANVSPQDYRGIIAQVPFVDVVTTMLDDGIPLTTNEYDEWGDPRDRICYEYILSYSPYDNVRAQAYPAMLVTTGLWDSQVQYYEPAKWVAKLRALKTDRNPLLLRVDMEAGHGGKSGRFQRYRETAMEYAFILDRLGIRD
ncbi:MAG: S9 family peptidase [Pseudomonadota bacterium]|nr:S9 family peptidase [Pseudomonadota bacterium]